VRWGCRVGQMVVGDCVEDCCRNEYRCWGGGGALGLPRGANGGGWWVAVGAGDVRGVALGIEPTSFFVAHGSAGWTKKIQAKARPRPRSSARGGGTPKFLYSQFWIF
jgi:hypothetical protein